MSERYINPRMVRMVMPSMEIRPVSRHRYIREWMDACSHAKHIIGDGYCDISDLRMRITFGKRWDDVDVNTCKANDDMPSEAFVNL